MERVYVPYWDWEDWQNGMWSTITNKQKEAIMIKEAIEFTGDHKKYGAAMREVVKEWHNTMLNSLTNTSINRRAFLGHCAVCYKLGIPEYIVRIAWKKLTENQRTLADAEAQSVINNYVNERKNKIIRKNMGKQMLLQWHS